MRMHAKSMDLHIWEARKQVIAYDMGGGGGGGFENKES
jgi:hypothetical protein